MFFSELLIGMYAVEKQILFAIVYEIQLDVIV